jgi:hypothetical protein
MAKVSVATGNWNTAATWGTVVNTPTLHASTSLTLTAGNTFTATFTAPNMTNAVYGVLLYMNTIQTGSMIVTLQESGVDTTAPLTQVTVNMNTMGVANQGTWVFYRFATPYTYTTTAAGAYRFRITMTGISGATSIAADSGGTLAAFLAVDDRNVAPLSTEDVWVCGYNGVTAQTVTLDGTITSGSGTDTSTLTTTSARSIGHAIQVCQGGVVDADTAAPVTITTLGNIMVSGNGEWNIGDSTTDYPQVYNHVLNQNGASARYGVHFNPNARRQFYGAEKAYQSTFYASGLGTVVSPLITADPVNWAVGDRLVIAGAVYNQFEVRYIITVNSATSYVLSATSGGAAAAFTNTHNTTHSIVNTTNNITFTTNNPSQAFYWHDNSTVAGALASHWVTFEYSGSTAANKNGIYPQFATGTVSDYQYCVAYAPVSYGFNFIFSSTPMSSTGLVVVNGNAAGGTSQVGFNIIQSDNKSFYDCIAIGMQAYEVSFTQTINSYWEDCYFWNGNGAGAAAQGAINVNANSHRFVNCSINGNRIAGIRLSQTAGPVGLTSYGTTFTDCNIGVDATNTLDISCASGGFSSALFTNCDFGSATLISGYTLMASDSTIGFDLFNGLVNDHRWYTAEGSFRSTGASLGDTTVRTPGSLNLRIAPESATGAYWDFYVLSRVSQSAIANGFIYCNAAFLADAGASVTVSLFLPGSLVADETVTMTKTTNGSSNDATFNLTRYFTGTVPLYSRIRINAITTTASAYVYVADIFGGTNPITNFTTWYNGQPSPIMFEQVGDSQAVWQVPTAALTTPGTTGKKLNDDLTTNKFIALK